MFLLERSGALVVKKPEDTASDIMRSQRKDKDLSQKVTAEFLGISQVYYGEIERGKKTPGRELAKRIQNFFSEVRMEMW